MKRGWIILILTIAGILFCACANVPGAEQEIGTFSYAEDSTYYEGMEGIGRKTDGFQNVERCRVRSAEEAIKLAKAEVTVEYDRTDAVWDEAEQMWQVSFWKENQVGGDQVVYLSSDGITQLCIWGE